MHIENNFPLAAYNTFGIKVSAKYFIKIKSVYAFAQLMSSKEYEENEKFILGGGSNILFTKDLKALCIYNFIKGIEIIKEDENHALIKAGSGEQWHDVVMYCIQNNLGGIENLSLIPGYAGAAPIQNIGAYGAELKDVFESLEAIDLLSGELKIFKHDDCRFGYRDSIFKRELKGKMMITSVTLKLSKHPKLNTAYGAIEDELKAMKISSPDIKSISQAVINIRRSKLPNPAEMGNAGSFFKNPEVSNEEYIKLKNNFPEMVAHKTTSDKMKLSAGWLIEQCGWKGKREGNVGMHASQALVLVNYGGASGDELYQFALRVKQMVKYKFGVTIEPEVNVV